MPIKTGEFTHNITPLTETLLKQLVLLESSGLLQAAPAAPEMEYLFRHILAQEAVYASLLHTDRQQLHQQAGELLERLYPEQAQGELALRLAQHFAEAGDEQRALHYYTLAGDRASQRYALPEAIAAYQQAIEIAQRQPEHAPLLHLHTSLGRALELSGRYPQAVENYRQMEAIALQIGDAGLELAALMALATVYAAPTDLYSAAQAQPLMDRALALAHQLSDLQAEARLLWSLQLLHSYSGETQQALYYGEQAQALARRLGDRQQLAFALNDMMDAYMSAGRIDKAQASLEEASALWQELDNLPMLADSLNGRALIHMVKGEFDTSLELTARSQQISRSISNLWNQSYSLMFSSLVYIERGEYGEALERMQRSLELARQAGFFFPQALSPAYTGWVYGLLGKPEQGLEIARQGTHAGQNMPVAYPWTLAIQATLEIQTGAVETARRTLETMQQARQGQQTHQMIQQSATLALAQAEFALIQAAPQNLQDCRAILEILQPLSERMRQEGARLYQPDSLLLQARALIAMGQAESGQTALPTPETTAGPLEQARACLDEAQQIAEALNARRSLWPVLAAQADLAEQAGEPGRAAALRQQAAEIIHFIAGHAPADLRSSFLAAPAVSQLLACIPAE